MLRVQNASIPGIIIPSAARRHCPKFRDVKGRRLDQRALALGLVLAALLIVFAALGAALGDDPFASDFEHGIAAHTAPVGPGAQHWLGTDRLFRDVLSRALVGLRYSLVIGIAATLITLLVGGAVGAIAGYFAGRRVPIDAVLMRIVDVGLALPFLLLAMAIASAFDKPTATTIFVTLGLTGWLGAARIVRARVLEVRERDFVTASRALGAHDARLLAAHVIPNSLAPLFVMGSLSVGQMILAESVMSYFGAGIAPPTPTLGRMLFEGQDSLQSAPWLFWVPAVLIVTCALAFHLVGEGLRARGTP